MSMRSIECGVPSDAVDTIIGVSGDGWYVWL